MSNNYTNFAFLQEMGIGIWQVREPRFFSHLEKEIIELPKECKLIFICEIAPSKDQLAFVSKILNSMNLGLDETYFLPPNETENILADDVFCWFVGINPQKTTISNAKVLHSCTLEQLENNPQAKRDLWQQIKSYDTTTSN